MGIDALLWPTGDEKYKDMTAGKTFDEKKEAQKDLKSDFLMMDKLNGNNGLDADWSLESDRYQVWKVQDKLRWRLWKWLRDGDSYGRYYAKIFGLVIHDFEAKPTVYRDAQGHPRVEIHSVRPALRKTISGSTKTDLVVEITQRRRGYFDEDEQAEMDASVEPLDSNAHGDFIYRAGATILIDMATQEVRRVIRTLGDIKSDEALDKVRRFRVGKPDTGDNAFDAGIVDRFGSINEPFAFLHQREEI